MVVKITPNDKGNPVGKLADAELHFTDGALEGMKLIGFAIWERRSGGGRKPHAVSQPGLQNALDRLIEPTARGSPTNPLRWTIKSTYRLARALRKQGYVVSATSVGRMLVSMHYSLQAIVRRAKAFSIRIGTASFATSRNG